MKYFRIVIFIFFALAFCGSVDCLIDSERASEQSGALFSMYICALGCVFATINPDDLL